jgi:Ala-tRNA(Pro) deacylase
MNVGEYLNERGIAFEVHDHPPAYTAQEVAAEEHVSGNILAKAVLIRDESGFALCVLPASYKLDMNKVAKVRKSKKARLADESEMAKLFPNVEVGAEPPFGNLYDVPTLVDEHLTANKDIVFQAGSHREAIRMKYSDYASLTQPKVADLAVHI